MPESQICCTSAAAPGPNPAEKPDATRKCQGQRQSRLHPWRPEGEKRHAPRQSPRGTGYYTLNIQKRYPLRKRSTTFPVMEGTDGETFSRQAQKDYEWVEEDNRRWLWGFYQISLGTAAMPAGKQSAREGSLHEHSDSRRRLTWGADESRVRNWADPGITEHRSVRKGCRQDRGGPVRTGCPQDRGRPPIKTQTWQGAGWTEASNGQVKGGLRAGETGCSTFKWSGEKGRDAGRAAVRWGGGV